MLVYVLNTSAGLREMFRSLELRVGSACVCVPDQRSKIRDRRSKSPDNYMRGIKVSQDDVRKGI